MRGNRDHTILFKFLQSCHFYLKGLNIWFVVVELFKNKHNLNPGLVNALIDVF